ncbi:MAG: protein kinase [Reyranellaceae bacterium]
MVEGTGDGGSVRPDVDLMTLQPGQTIGRYRIESVLGQGGFGITYRAVDAELGRHVAIKEYLPAALAVRKDGITVVPRSQTAAEDLAWGLDRFVEEGRTLAALHRAPGIVKVHDYLRANGTAYLVMELVDGETLHDRIQRKGPLDAAAIDRLLAPLLDGLEQVHAAGFLHRDIKPANILLDAKDQPTLIDFGASRAAIAGRSQALTAVFTPGYAPVEQFTSATQGPWTDLYSLAASLHDAVTGSPPPNAIDRLLEDSYAPLARSGLAYPGALLAGIDAALAVRAADRPQSVAAWRATLRGLAMANPPAATVAMPGTGMGIASPVVSPAPAQPPAPTAPVARARKSSTAAKVAAAVGLLLVLGGGGWFMFGSGTTPPPPPPPSPPASAAPAPAPPPSAVAAAPTPPPHPDRAQQELEQARREQRAAMEEATRLRAEAEARRKADEEAALRARIEQEVRDKAAAEEAQRQAETTAQAKAEAEAKARADAEAAARKAEEADPKAAEAREASLRLTVVDRQRIQVALTSLGHATGATDGVFGPRSREMIAAWQRKSGHAATGFLTQDQQAALLRESAPALARYDEEQRKLAAAQPPDRAPGGGAQQCEGTFRSQWCRSAYQGFPPNCWNANMTIRNGEVSDSWVSQSDRTQRNIVTGRIDANGNVSLNYRGVGQQTHIAQHFTAIMSGRVTNGVLTAAGRAGQSGRDFSVTVTCR